MFEDITFYPVRLRDQQYRPLSSAVGRECNLGAERLWIAWGWCTGTTQRDGMGREEGGGFRMGNTCIPVPDSF